MSRLIALVSLLLVFIPLTFAQDADAVIPAGEKILAWVGPGQSPPNKPSATPGQLVFITADGTVEPVMDLPANLTHAFPCAGASATSPNGQYFVFFMGRDTGELHLMTGTQVPTLRLRE